jgi:hypothetical protein
MVVTVGGRVNLERNEKKLVACVVTGSQIVRDRRDVIYRQRDSLTQLSIESASTSRIGRTKDH